VKKFSSSAARLMGLFMTDPPSAARAAALPQASVPESHPNTTACGPRIRGQDRQTREAIDFGDPDRIGTTARGCLLRIGGANSVDGISAIIPAPGLFRQLSQMDVFSDESRNSQSHAWRNNQGAVKSPGRDRWAPTTTSIRGRQVADAVILGSASHHYCQRPSQCSETTPLNWRLCTASAPRTQKNRRRETPRRPVT
jgi:hypothetical protein